MKKTRSICGRGKGAALILAIFTSVILTVLAVSLVEIVRVEVIASRSALDRLQARYLAKAGFNLARSLLMYEDEQEVDGPEDIWFALDEGPPLELGEGSCRLAVIDACSFVNVNTADEAMLSRIVGEVTLAQGIVHWREENGPFRSLGELAEVEGMSQERLEELARFLTVISLERNVTASGKKRVNISQENDPSQMVRSLGITQAEAQSIVRYRRSQPEKRIQSVGELVRVPLPRPRVKEIIDKVTVTDEEYNAGRVNLNTASPEVLSALPGASPQFVEALLARRQEGDGALQSLGDLLGFPGVSEDDFVSLCEVACTKSSTFMIEASASLDERPVQRTIQGVVLRQPGPIAPIISGWRELSRPMFLSPKEAG